MSCRGTCEVVSRFQAQRALSTSITVMIHYTGMTARQGFDGLKESERRAFVINFLKDHYFWQILPFWEPKRPWRAEKQKRDKSDLHLEVKAKSNQNQICLCIRAGGICFFMKGF
jgi:hypothetical protein